QKSGSVAARQLRQVHRKITDTKNARRLLPPGAGDFLRIQVGVGIELVVLEDVAGLDGLHEPLVAGVHDGGGQTLHHAHGHQGAVHDGTDVLGRAVGAVGQTAGGLESLVGEELDGVEHVHLLVLHALDHQEQRVEPQVVGLHAQRHAAVEHVVAVGYALVVVLGDAVGRAQGNDDGVVGGGQVDVAD